MSVLRERPVDKSDDGEEKKVAEVLVRWVPENQQVGIVIRSCSTVSPFFSDLIWHSADTMSSDVTGLPLFCNFGKPGNVREFG